MNESFKTDPSLATSARAASESGSYLCASNVTPTAVRFIVSVFLCLLCSCRMSSTQMTCSHFRKNRPKKRQKPSGCRSRIISKNRPVPIFGRSTGASLLLSIIYYLPTLLEVIIHQISIFLWSIPLLFKSSYRTIKLVVLYVWLPCVFEYVQHVIQSLSVCTDHHSGMHLLFQKLLSHRQHLTRYTQNVKLGFEHFKCYWTN